MRKIYLASSWRNPDQPEVVRELRLLRHEVYDFREPGSGFSWDDIDHDWQDWDAEEFIGNLSHPLAIEGFDRDHFAMHWADTFVLLLPCGKSAHLELGWAVGAGKETFVMLGDRSMPELMYKLADHIVTTMDELRRGLAVPHRNTPIDGILKGIQGMSGVSGPSGNRTMGTVAKALIDRGCPSCEGHLSWHSLTVWCNACGWGKNWEDIRHASA